MIELNVQQQSVVNAPIDENLVVIAGAGTGKTCVIISRICRLLQDHNIRPNQILAISFSKDTRLELKQRMERELGYRADKIRLGTFNSLGWRILNDNRQAAGLAPDTKVRTESETWYELKAYFKSQYKLNFLYHAREESAFKVDAVLGAENHNYADNEFHGALYRAWNALSQGQKNVSRNLSVDGIPLPKTSLEHFAQVWGMLFFPSIAPDLNTQITNFRVLGQNSAFDGVVDQMEQSYNLFFDGMWNAISQQTDFKLGPQWLVSMFLNNGAPDVSTNCWLELSMWCNQRENLGRVQFAIVPNRAEFSMQELTSYVIKRKEEGALPRIGFEKYQYYKEHLSEAWSQAHPCDLARLNSIAPDYLKKYLKCPFQKDTTLTMYELFMDESIAELKAYEQSLSSNKDKDAGKKNGMADAKGSGELVEVGKGSGRFVVKNRNGDKGANGAGSDEENYNPNKKPLHELFVKGKLNDEQIRATGESCSCSFCPFFLDWYELLFAFYEEWREARHYMDFPEQINRCVRLLKQDHQIRERQQQQIKFIFVDEFQDTNNMQFEMLCLLKTDESVPAYAQNYLCVVGDDDQSIYCWRGADMRCLERIMHQMQMSHDRLKMLTINYRSHQNILNVANSLIGHNSYRLIAKRLVCPQAFAFEQMNPNMQIGFDPSSPRINIVGFESYKLEGRAVAQAVTYLHNQFNLPYHEIAVLFRMNFLSAAVEFSLLQARIPFFSKDPAFAMRTPVRYALAAIRLALDPNDDEAFVMYCACIEPRRASKHLAILQQQQNNLRNSTLNGNSNKAAAYRNKILAYVNENKLSENELEGTSWAVTNAMAEKKQVLVEVDEDEGSLSEGKQLKDSKERQAHLDSKIRLLCEQAALDPKHELSPSLYGLLQEMSLHPNEDNQKLLKFFEPLLAHIDEVQHWSTSLLSLDSVISFILEQTGIFQRYTKKDDGETELDLEQQDDLVNIEQLMLLGAMMDDEDEANFMSLTASIKAKMLKEHPNFDPNDVEVNAKFQELARKEALVLFAEKVEKQVKADPCVQAELSHFPQAVLRQRMQLRYLVFQLLPECHAPWSESLRKNHVDEPHKDDTDKVQMLSIHASKGKEFQAVIVIGCENKIIPYISSNDGPSKIDEERRLAYVAFTRAKRYLFITFCRNRMNNKGKVKDSGRSVFVNEALAPWKDCPREQRPYYANLIRAEDFSKGNVWEGRIDR